MLRISLKLCKRVVPSGNFEQIPHFDGFGAVLPHFRTDQCEIWYGEQTILYKISHLSVKVWPVCTIRSAIVNFLGG